MRPIDRGAQQEAFDVLAELVEVFDVVPTGEAVELHPVQLGVLQVAGLDRAAGLGDLAVEDQPEGVARLDVALEVELVGEQLDHFGGDLRRGPDVLGALIERTPDGAVGDGGLVAELLVQLAQP